MMASVDKKNVGISSNGNILGPAGGRVAQTRLVPWTLLDVDLVYNPVEIPEAILICCFCNTKAKKTREVSSVGMSDALE